MFPVLPAKMDPQLKELVELERKRVLSIKKCKPRMFWGAVFFFVLAFGFLKSFEMGYGVASILSGAVSIQAWMQWIKLQKTSYTFQGGSVTVYGVVNHQD
ncbi:hypothetical protein ACFYKX_10385 [Cytobacillus sp. FJAT-54145]|uniref:Uncharacterized protein n=1 Tax=Cytobacillus spartinae TaxID=3299023 RepID=A0ABW6K9X7_9BACI